MKKSNAPASKRTPWIVAMLLATGCAPSPSAKDINGLIAGPVARSFGVGSYLVEGDAVHLLDADGVELGQLALSRTSDAGRLARFEMNDGMRNDVEITRPTERGFELRLEPRDVYYATLSDPALAPALARFQISVGSLAPHPSEALSLEDIAVCRATNTATCKVTGTNTNCTAGSPNCVCCSNPSELSCTLEYDYTQYDYDNWSPDIGQCQTICNGNNYQYVWEDSYGDWACVCGHRFTKRVWPGSCARYSCGTVGQYDQVNRISDCTDPGSCANSSLFAGCTAYH